MSEKQQPLEGKPSCEPAHRESQEEKHRRQTHFQQQLNHSQRVILHSQVGLSWLFWDCPGTLCLLSPKRRQIFLLETHANNIGNKRLATSPLETSLFRTSQTNTSALNLLQFQVPKLLLEEELHFHGSCACKKYQKLSRACAQPPRGSACVHVHKQDFAYAYTYVYGIGILAWHCTAHARVTRLR